MKNYLSNWNFRRIIYLIGGIFFVLVAINDRTWWIPFGLYFIAMAVFRFGCASGNCEIPLQKKDSELQN